MCDSGGILWGEILKNERGNEMKTQYVWKCETNFEEIERVHVDLNYFI